MVKAEFYTPLNHGIQPREGKYFISKAILHDDIAILEIYDSTNEKYQIKKILIPANTLTIRKGCVAYPVRGRIILIERAEILTTAAKEGHDITISI